MQIFVKTLSGGMFSLEVARRDTIESVKMKLQEKHGCSSMGQLAHIDTVKKTYVKLQDKRTIADYKIRPESTLFYIGLLRSGGAGHNVRFPDGSVQNLRTGHQTYFRPFASIRELQEGIREKHGVHISLQRLTREGREVDADAFGDICGGNTFDLEIIPVSCTTKAAFDAEVRDITAAAEAKAAEEATAEALASTKASEMAQRVRHVIDRLACNDATMTTVELSGKCASYVCYVVSLLYQ